jgi:hypothetical protein
VWGLRAVPRESADCAMSNTMMKGVIENHFQELVMAEPEWARLMEIVRRRLRDGFYPEWFVEACFQHWVDTTPAELLVFSDLYIRWITGQLCICRVSVDSEPGPDQDKASNQQRLDTGLPQGFSALVRNGPGGGDDGDFSWNRELRLTRTTVQPDESDKVELWPLAAGWGSLEIGYTKVERTYFHLYQKRILARWPYGSKDVVLIAAHSSFKESERLNNFWPAAK